MPGADATISNLRDAFITFNGLCGGRSESFPGVTCVSHPSRLSGFNMAFLHGAEGTEGRVLRRAQGFFREIKTEWCLVVPPPLAGLFDIAARRIRISERRAVPEMVLDPRDVSVPPPPAVLQVRRVKTVADLRTWSRTSQRGFGSGRRNPLRTLAHRGSLEAEGFTFNLGLVSGKPVATSASFVSEGVDGIFAVSTLPKERGHGYGEAMTWATVRDGISRGCGTIALQASPLGFPIYYRMGFRRIFDFEEWVVPRDAPDARGLADLQRSNSPRADTSPCPASPPPGARPTGCSSSCSSRS